jgi:nicotinate-nucleotide adenylyltransferase
MTLLEKIIYMADYIEPNREFDGVDELRVMAYEDIDEALRKGLEMSIADIAERGLVAHPATLAALAFLR